MTSSHNSPLVWFITGCSSGLGRALASKALERGELVVATARNAQAINDLALAYPETCRSLELDVTDSVQIQAAVREAVEAFGRIDVVVNNAGYGLLGAFEELSLQQITRNFEVNFFGALDVIRNVLPVLRSQTESATGRRAHLVNISAAAAISNYAGFSIYGATKWALEGVSESLAAELKPHKIAVTIVEPGPFRTEFISRSMETAERRMPDYEQTSGKFLQILKTMDGKQPGDPQKAAEAIITAVKSERPPLRLVLGKYATAKALKRFESGKSELEAWRAVGEPTDLG